MSWLSWLPGRPVGVEWDACEGRQSKQSSLRSFAGQVNREEEAAKMQNRKDQQQQVSSQQFRIITQYGDMLVVRQALQSQPQAQESPSNHSKNQQQQQQPQTRPVIMTFHDLGLNSELQFSGFCECDEVKLMLQTFTMLHVNFIGQEPQAERLPKDFRYPSPEQLAECIVDVCAHLRVRSFIALAVGLGAHVASLVALQRPDLVDGLFLVNPVASSCSITEWLYFKMSAIASNRHFSPNLPHEDHSEQQSPRHESGATRGGGLWKLIATATHIHHSARHQQPQQLQPQQQQQQRRNSNESAEDATSIASGHSLDQTSRSSSPGAASSRLRRLILSRNFRLAGQHAEAPASAESPQRQRKSSRDSNSSGESQTANQRRPPLEYLMYHHFGPTSFQRYSRRGSGTSSPAAQSSPRASGRQDRGLKATRSHESLGSGGSGGQQDRHHHQRNRSGSLKLSSAYLASLANERQRSAHMQMAYKHHFNQLEPHNLWLLAHSFAKRRSLSLRKDCGAAAHAAAAAAALGTSICTAFVGAAPVAGGGATPPKEPSARPTSAGEQRALVAGTKVKRTFACQTLVMCSAVGLHCERAFKLMSLLNPLQATCIKTQQLLVLEEKPEKVCQALRLFLQGIGYSMSTYERRLRLSSHTGSAGSNDSGGSLPSLGARD